MPTERRGPICNSQYEGVSSRMFDSLENDAFTQFRHQGRQQAGISSSFTKAADLWTCAKPVAAAILYWGITLGGIAGMGALGYHLLNIGAQHTQMTDTKDTIIIPRPR